MTCRLSGLRRRYTQLMIERSAHAAGVTQWHQVSETSLDNARRYDMKELTARDLARDVFPSARSVQEPELVRRMEALAALVLDLLAEVEALRQAQATRSDYRDAYRATCLLTHNSAGPSSGWEKLIDCYYPRHRSSDGRVWRESVMMRRLGLAPDEIEAYKREAEEAEMYT